MNEKERKDFVNDISSAVSSAISESNSTCEFCMSEERRIVHRQDHEFIESLIKLADRINNVKWGVLSGVLKVLLAAAILGGIAFAWKHGVNG